MSKRTVRITCDVEWERMDTILSVLHKEVFNVHVDEITPKEEPPKYNPEAIARKRVPGANWAVQFYWPLIRPILEKANGEAVYFKCQEIADIFINRGRNPTGASTVFTNLARAGLVEWVGKGLYRLKRE